jgi:transcriptional regulator with XRE-family HTH domain
MTETEYRNELIRSLRRLNGWSAAEFAQRIGTSRQTLNEIEKGAYCSAELLQSIGAAFGIDHRKLLRSAGEGKINPADIFLQGMSCLT